MTYLISKIAKNQTHLSVEHQSRILNFSRFNMDDDTFFDFAMIITTYESSEMPTELSSLCPPQQHSEEKKNSQITVDLGLWKRNNGGHSFDSSTGFKLPNDAVRSPDASWVSDEKY